MKSAALGTAFAATFVVALAGSGLRAEEARAPRLPLARTAQSGAPPPSNIPGEPGEQGGDAGALVVRIVRLENQLRAANGAIEELQNQQRKLEEQLRRVQEEVGF